MSSDALIRFDNLTLGYHHHPAVHHLQGEIVAGSLLAVVGPNGAGKSTLLKGIVGELRPLQGRVELCGIKREHIAYLTQQSTLDGSFPIVIYDFVAMGLWAQFGAFRGFNRAARQRVDEAIAAVNAGHFAGPVRVGMVQDFAESLLSGLLARFSELHPDSQIYSRVAGTADLLTMLIQICFLWIQFRTFKDDFS